MTTVQKIRRMQEISILHKRHDSQAQSAFKKMVKLRQESIKLLRSISKKDCALYAEKIAKYVCAS